MYKAMLRMLGVATLVGSAACLPTYDSPAPSSQVQTENGPERSGAEGSSDSTNVTPLSPAQQTEMWQQGGDPALLADRAYDEGPLAVAAARHSCMKMKYDSVGRLLTSRGINIIAGTNATALPVTISTTCPAVPTPGSAAAARSQTSAFVYCNSRLTLGLPLYSARLAEATSVTTASGTKMMDLYASASAEIVTSLTNGALTTAACKDKNSNNATLFNADNTCNEAGITCLQGFPATADQVALCTRIVSQADITPANTAAGTTQVDAITTGKRLAVAAILSATHVCE